MHVFILTLGSRGDIQPFVALGVGLQAAGHAVTICTSSNFEGFVRDRGLNYAYTHDELMKLMDSDAGRDALENTTNAFEAIATFRKLAARVGPLQRQMLDETWDAARAADPDLIIFHPKAYSAPRVAEILNVPVLMAIPLPMYVPTATFPNIGFPNLPLGGWYNKLTYILVQKLAALWMRPYLRAWQKKHDLPPQACRAELLRTRTGKAVPILHCYSQHVVPAPADWPAGAIATGYWFLERQDTWEPPPELQRFLEEGDRPVYVGFGSMAGRDPQRLTRIVVAALQQANVRGVLATGWGGLEAIVLPETIFKIRQAPHDWLFPRVAAVVHHGGAGTTAAGLRAGCPTVICPFFGDQPFWGKRVRALGAGSEPIPQKQLTVEKLAAALREVTANPEIRQNAETLGAKIRAEDGIGNAIAFLEKML